jgi:HSP20 family protein
MKSLAKPQTNLVPTSFSDLFDRFFNESVNQFSQSVAFVPQADVFETEDAYHIHLNVPGIDKKDINVEVQEGILTISGERKQVAEDKKAHRIESYYGGFSRSFRVPEKAKGDAVKARYENGVLEITLPKDEQKTKRFNVDVI